MSVSARFTNALIDLDNKLREDEWFFCKLREEIVESLSPEVAFSEITGTLELALQQEEVGLFIEVLELSLSLIRKASTTEIPIGLEQQLIKLKNCANKFGKDIDYSNRQIKEIQGWFRIKSNQASSRAKVNPKPWESRQERDEIGCCYPVGEGRKTQFPPG